MFKNKSYASPLISAWILSDAIKLGLDAHLSRSQQGRKWFSVYKAEVISWRRGKSRVGRGKLLKGNLKIEWRVNVLVLETKITIIEIHA